MRDAPQPGDRFITADGQAPRVVATCHLGVSSPDEPTRYVVRAEDGSQWFLIARVVHDLDVRWSGIPFRGHDDAG